MDRERLREPRSLEAHQQDSTSTLPQKIFLCFWQRTLLNFWENNTFEKHSNSSAHMTARPFCRRVDPGSGGPSGSFAGARAWIAGLAGRCSEPPG